MLGFKNRVIVEVRVVDKVFGSLKSLFFLFFVLDGFGMVAFFFVCRLVIWLVVIVKVVCGIRRGISGISRFFSIIYFVFVLGLYMLKNILV